MKCKIVLKVNDVSYEFNSEQELNEKLIELLSTEVLNTPSISHIRWSISGASSAEKTDTLIKDIHSQVEKVGYTIKKNKSIGGDHDDDFEDEYISINNSAAVTKLFELRRGIRNEPMVESFESRIKIIKDNWLKLHIGANTFGIKRGTMTDIEYDNALKRAAEDAWDKSEVVNKMSNVFGTWYHALIKTVFEGGKLKDVKVPAILNLSEDFKQQVYNSVISLTTQIKNLHSGAKFYTEIPVVAKNISGDLSKMIGKKEHAGGTIDLLVRDIHGDVYIYDFKTSFKELIIGLKTNESWDVAKLKRTLYQLEAYAAILKQYGINVVGKGIIPINVGKIDTNKYTLSELESGKDSEGNSIEYLTNISLGGKKSTDGTPVTFVSAADLIQSTSDDNQAVMRDDLKEIRGWFNIKRVTMPDELLKLSNDFHALCPISDSIHIIDNIGTSTIRDSFLEKKLFDELTEKGNFKSYAKGFRWKVDLKKHKLVNSVSLLDFDPEQVQDTTVYFTDEQKAKWKTILFDAYKAERQKNFDDIYDSISSIISKKSESEFNNFVEYWGRKSPWLSIILKPYLLGEGWNLYSDENLAANGYYIFEKNGTIEIVMISDENLDKKYDFSKSSLSLHVGQNASTVAGNFFKDEDIGNKNVLNATAGNFLIMKAALYLSKNYSEFKDYKINTIRAVNIERGQHRMVSNTEIIDSWRQLAYGAALNKITLNDLPPNFAKDWEAFYGLADNIASTMMSSYYKSTMETGTPFEPEEYIKHITDLIKTYETNRKPILVHDFYNHPDYLESNTVIAYLERALLSLQHYQFRHEGDISTIEKEITAPANSSKFNQQVLNTLISEYNHAIRAEFQETSRQWRAVLKDALNEAGVGSFGNETLMFKQWLDEDETLVLRPASDPFWKSRPKQFTAYSFFVEKLNQYVPSGEEGKLNLNLPLVKGSFINRMEEAGLFEAVKSGAKDLYDVYKKPFVDELDDPDRRSKNFSSDSERREYIERYGLGYFSLNLDHVFNYTMQQEIQKKYRNHYEIYFTSVQTTINFMSQFDNYNWDPIKQKDKNPLYNLTKYCEDYLNSRGRNQSLIDPDLRKWYTVLSKLAQHNSFIQLAGNLRTLAREFLTSSAIGLTRANAELMPGVTVKSWTDAITMILGSDNWTMDSFTNQMNLRFGMANMDINQLADAVKYAKWNPHNLRKNRAYFSSSLTDFVVRNGILFAKMLSDGTMNKEQTGAYHLDTDGELIYDFDRDTRFDALRTWNTKHPEFYEQLGRYNAIAEDLNLRILHSDSTKPLYKILDPKSDSAKDVAPLFEGYTRSEIAGIRNHADTLYGHYNDENQMLVQDRFMGHFIMSFKTYVSSRLEQNFSGATHVNVSNFTMNTSESGQKLYIKTSADGQISFVTRDQVSDEELANGTAKPWQSMLSANHQGIINNLIGMGRAMAHWKDDKEGWHKWWAKPMHRALFLLFLEDTLMTMILMMLTNMIFGFEPNTKFNRMRSETWLRKWSYSVAMGAFKDGPFTNVLHQMSDINPPLIGAIQDWYSGAVDVITGEDNFLHVFTQNVGAFREFSGYFELDD